MLSIHTEKITCSNCKTELDVPVYQNNENIQYGMRFCHQCGKQLFIESDDKTFISKDFLYWLVDKSFQCNCVQLECTACDFSINENGFDVKCGELTDEQKLQILKKMYNRK